MRRKRIKNLWLAFPPPCLPGSLRWMVGGQANANHLRCIPLVQYQILIHCRHPVRQSTLSHPQIEGSKMWLVLSSSPHAPPWLSHSRSRKKDRDMYSFRYTSFTEWGMIYLSLSFSSFNGSERLGGTGVHKGEDNVLMEKKKKKSWLHHFCKVAQIPVPHSFMCNENRARKKIKKINEKKKKEKRRQMDKYPRL